MSNSTNKSRIDSYSFWLDYIRDTSSFYIVYNIVLATLGTVFNVWFAGSILSCRVLRQSFRNQLIGNLALSHLIQTLFVSPVEISLSFQILNPPYSRDKYCLPFAIYSIMGHIQSGLDDWLVVFIIATFVVNNLKIDLETKFNLTTRRACKVLMHVLPWIIVVTASTTSIVYVFGSRKCYRVPKKIRWLYETFYTLIPNGISFILMVWWYVMKRRQAGTGGNSYQQSDDATSEAQDAPLVYVLTMFAIFFCEINSLFVLFEQMKYKMGYKVNKWAEALTYSRVFFGLLPFLLIPDIRERISSWRPWKREIMPSGIDLAVECGRNADP